MQYSKKFYTPGPEDTSGSQRKPTDAEKETIRKENELNEHKEKTTGSKIKDALQQWSNDDERDRAIDDSSPLRSGL